MSKLKCAICNIAVNEKNSVGCEIGDFHQTCNNHKQYKNTFLILPTSEMLGYSEPKEKHCIHCKNVLTFKEVCKCLIHNAFDYKCSKHLNA